MLLRGTTEPNCRVNVTADYVLMGQLLCRLMHEQKIAQLELLRDLKTQAVVSFVQLNLVVTFYQHKMNFRKLSQAIGQIFPFGVDAAVKEVTEKHKLGRLELLDDGN